MKLRTFLVMLAVVAAACGGGQPSVSEYAAQAEELVAEMVGEFAALDAAWEAQRPSVRGAERYWEGRLAVRANFLDGVNSLDPPDAIAGQHAAAVDVFTRINAADQALADLTATFDSVTEHWQWVATDEGRAANALLEEVFAFCRASQAAYDSTKDRRGLQDLPWIPSEASEVVSVASGCPPA